MDSDKGELTIYLCIASLIRPTRSYQTLTWDAVRMQSMSVFICKLRECSDATSLVGEAGPINRL